MSSLACSFVLDGDREELGAIRRELQALRKYTALTGSDPSPAASQPESAFGATPTARTPRMTAATAAAGVSDRSYEQEAHSGASGTSDGASEGNIGAESAADAGEAQWQM